MHTWRFTSLAASTFPFTLIAQATRKKRKKYKLMYLRLITLGRQLDNVFEVVSTAVRAFTKGSGLPRIFLRGGLLACVYKLMCIFCRLHLGEKRFHPVGFHFCSVFFTNTLSQMADSHIVPSCSDTLMLCVVS